jgi:hypothetical protein
MMAVVAEAEPISGESAWFLHQGVTGPPLVKESSGNSFVFSVIA